jgi:hypothetical protein
MNINKLYGLYCPITDELKYIGITKNSLKERLSGHLCNPTNYLTKKWFAELKKNELKPIIRLIESFDTYEELLQSEINEIKKCRELNMKILNLHDGGSFNPMLGKTHTEESRKKMSKNNKGERNPNFKYKIEKDELFDLYVIQNKTIKELSVIYNCVINTINKNLRKYNINKPKSNIYNLDEVKIKDYLSNGLSQVEIGRIFNCSHKIIHKFIKRKKIYASK